MRRYRVTWTKEVEIVLATEDDVDKEVVRSLAERMSNSHDVDDMDNGFGWDTTVTEIKTTSQNATSRLMRSDYALVDGRMEDIDDCGHRFDLNIIKYKMETVDALGPYTPHVVSKYNEDTDTWSHEVSVRCEAALEPEAFEVYQAVLDKLVLAGHVDPTVTSVVWLGRLLT